MAAAQGGARQGPRLARCWHCPPPGALRAVGAGMGVPSATTPGARWRGRWLEARRRCPQTSRHQPRWPGPRCVRRRAAAPRAALMGRPSPVRRALEEGAPSAVPRGAVGDRSDRQGTRLSPEKPCAAAGGGTRWLAWAPGPLIGTACPSQTPSPERIAWAPASVPPAASPGPCGLGSTGGPHTQAFPLRPRVSGCGPPPSSPPVTPRSLPWPAGLRVTRV